MISALFYLQFHSILNRLLVRFKRLKQPKYLVGAIVGGLYFYWYFGRVIFWPLARGANGSAALPGWAPDPQFYESLGAIILGVVVFLGWVIPHQRAALVFTEAEIAFLFPAPVSRRGLIHYKLLRSQLGILFTVFFFTLLSSRFGSGGRALIHAAGWWIILFTLNLHFIASSFALTKLMDSGISNWTRRLIILALALLLVGGVGCWTARSIPELTPANFQNATTFFDYVKQAMVSGPLPYLLYPFRLVVRPYLAPDWLSFLKVLGPALLLMGLHYLWVMRADVAFEEASVEASKKMADRLAAARAGKWGTTGKSLKRKRPPFRLSPTGPASLAIFWKNLIGAGSAFTARTWIVLVIIAVIMSSTLFSTTRSAAWPTFIAVMSGMFGAWSILIGPHILRQDFRQDLPQADLLKLYPLRGWQIALGEILAPTVILTAFQWLLVLIAAACVLALAEREISGGLVLAIGASAVMLLPMLNMISLIIPNAAVLWFPSWFQTGKDAPQGIEATGQRLIFVFGQLLAFVVALVPAAGLFFGIFLLIKLTINAMLATIVGGLAATLVLAIEAGLGVMLLGWLFDRLDLSTETTG